MLKVLRGRFVTNPAQKKAEENNEEGRKHKCQQFHIGTGLHTRAHTHAQPPALIYLSDPGSVHLCVEHAFFSTSTN